MSKKQTVVAVVAPVVAVAPFNAVPATQRAAHASFIVSKLNVRTIGGLDVTELAALIFSAGGVIQNVIAFKQMKKGKWTGIYEIVAGGRRWRAVELLIAEGKFPADVELNFLEVSEEQAVIISLTENSGRVACHPADEFEAMQELVRLGKTIEDVAAAFGLLPVVVKRRLRLANIAPSIFQLYKNGKANLEQLQALALTDDHEKQEQAWNVHGVHSRANDLRRLLTSEKVDVQSDRVAKYVGVAAYEKAGGMMIKDLFSDKGEGYMENVALLHKLALEKLEKQSKKLLAEGCAWVDVVLAANWDEINAYGRPRTVRVEPTEEQEAALTQIALEQTTLAEERDKLEDDEDADDDAIEALEKRETDLDEREESIQEALVAPHPEDANITGALVTIDHSGKCEIRRNLVRPADVKKIKQEAKVAAGGEALEDGKPAHSEKLTRQLTGHRTAALQAELMNCPDVALVAIVHRLVSSVFFSNYHTSIVKVRMDTASLSSSAHDMETSKAWAAITAKKAALQGLLPKEDKDGSLFAWLLSQEQSVVLDLLAFCTALSVDAIQGNDTPCVSFTGLAKALELNMCDWWEPTQASYFQHVPKLRIVEVVTAAVSSEIAMPLALMKKGAAAEAAERAVMDTRWLPHLLKVA